MKKGEFWLVALPEGLGSEQQGFRPCLVVQNDIGNTYSTTTIVCPVTTKNKNFNATHVKVDCLDYPSYVMCEQVRVISQERLIKYLCDIDNDSLIEVNKKLRVALAI